MKKKKKLSNKKWLWEFSKKVVVICFAFYVIEQIYIMWQSFGMMDDYSYLVFTNCNDNVTKVLCDVVAFYFVKAGLENVTKIRKSNKDNNEEEIQELGPDEYPK